MLKILLFSLLLLQGCNNTNSPVKTEVANTSITLENRCDLKPETGHCRAMFRHYYFDASSKSCKEFVYGGCGGVVPFKTLESCQSSCEK